MRITAIHESVESIASDIENAYINFSKMTCSVVAVVTDQIIDGKPVVGYGFNSNGRYNASGILKDRLIPRLLEADPGRLIDGDGYLDPHRAWDIMMTNEKPGGHGERSGAGRLGIAPVHEGHRRADAAVGGGGDGGNEQ